jgi:hypothetical protein
VSFRSALETISPRALADAADRHGVDPALAEALIASALRERPQITGPA